MGFFFKKKNPKSTSTNQKSFNLESLDDQAFLMGYLVGKVGFEITTFIGTDLGSNHIDIMASFYEDSFLKRSSDLNNKEFFNTYAINYSDEISKLTLELDNSKAPSYTYLKTCLFTSYSTHRMVHQIVESYLNGLKEAGKSPKIKGDNTNSTSVSYTIEVGW